MAHLAIGKPAPWQYTELMLCRDVYHCTPAQLDDVPIETIREHLECMRQEARVAKMRKGRR